MKRFFFLFLLFLSVHVTAQDLKFGAKAGLNLSTVTGDVLENINPRLAYHFGAFANVPLSDRFSLHPELLYLSIGSTFKLSADDINDPFVGSFSFRSVQRANFLAVPINFRLNFTDRFGLDFGPQVSFLINSVNKVKETSNIDEELTRRSVSGDFRPDYGANLGLTFTLSEKINLQLRYYQGLKNLIRGSFSQDNTSYNVALQVSAGYVLF